MLYSSFSQIILTQNECGIQFHPPTSSDDHCFSFCEILLLYALSLSLPPSLPDPEAPDADGVGDDDDEAAGHVGQHLPPSGLVVRRAITRIIYIAG